MIHESTKIFDKNIMLLSPSPINYKPTCFFSQHVFDT